jgi:YhcH/YjgK/YiaL family protein
MAPRFLPLLPGLEAAVAFLSGFESGGRPDGRHEIDGNRLYALVSRYATRSADETLPEGHLRYVDVQYLASGRETVYWSPLSEAGPEVVPYDRERDVRFFARERVKIPLSLHEGMFAVFFPDDIHQPGCNLDGRAEVEKVVVKVLLDESPPAAENPTTHDSSTA